MVYITSYLQTAYGKLAVCVMCSYYYGVAPIFSTYRMIKRLHSHVGKCIFLQQPLQTAGERQSSAYGGVHTQSCTRYNPIYSAGNAAVIIQREERFSRVQPEVSIKFPAALMELGTEIISPYKRGICAELFTILT